MRVATLLCIPQNFTNASKNYTVLLNKKEKINSQQIDI